MEVFMCICEKCSYNVEVFQDPKDPTNRKKIRSCCFHLEYFQKKDLKECGLYTERKKLIRKTPKKD